MKPESIEDNGNTAAFPQHPDNHYAIDCGLSKREYFSIHIMAAAISGATANPTLKLREDWVVARECVRAADSLIAALGVK